MTIGTRLLRYYRTRLDEAMWQGSLGQPAKPLRPELWCRGPESNWRHRDFQSRALPTELPRHEERRGGAPSNQDTGEPRSRPPAPGGALAFPAARRFGCGGLTPE